jgi:hypothetical protein
MPIRAFTGTDEIKVTDGTNSAIVGAFGEVKAAALVPQISEVFTNPLDLQRDFTAGGTYASQYNRSLLKVSGDAGGTSFVQTKRNLRYVTGQTIEINFTASWSKTSLADYSLVGAFDANNGVYVGYVGENFVVGYRNANVGADTTAIIDVSNLLTFGNLTRFRIRFAYLGTGNITFEAYLGSKYHLLHTFETDGNLFERTHIGVPLLPMRAEVGSTDPTYYITSGSWGAGIYGSASPNDKPFFHKGIRSVNPAAGAELPIVAYRSKTSFGGFVNRVRSQLTGAQFATANEGIYLVNFYAYPAGSIATGAWANVSPYSVIEYNNTSTGVPAGGINIFSTIITVAGIGAGNSSSVEYDFAGLGLVANAGDEFLITLQCVIDSGGINTETIWCLNYNDLF